MNIRVHLQGIMCLICGLALLGSLVSAQKGEAGTYYVATDGSDSNPGTEEQPFQTLGRGVGELRPGDTLYVKNGTYTGSSQLAGIPSGASRDNPITIAAYPGHSPVIVAEQDNHVLYFSNNRYIIIDGFVIDGSNAIHGIRIHEGSGGIADHIRIQNSEILYASDSGIVVTPGSDGNEFINLQVHDNGIKDSGHGIYISSSNNIVEDCSVHDNKGWGIHVYTVTSAEVNDNIVRNNEIYNNGRSGRGPGIIFSHGSGNQAYNNDIWGNIGGIQIDYGASDTYISSNTIHNNTEYGIYIGMGSINARIEFNSIYDNNGPSIINEGVLTHIPL